MAKKCVCGRSVPYETADYCSISCESANATPRVWMPDWHDLRLPETVDTGSGSCVRFGDEPTEPCPEGGRWVEVDPERVPRWVREGLA